MLRVKFKIIIYIKKLRVFKLNNIYKLLFILINNCFIFKE